LCTSIAKLLTDRWSEAESHAAKKDADAAADGKPICPTGWRLNEPRPTSPDEAVKHFPKESRGPAENAGDCWLVARGLHQRKIIR
jgi:hypothetical protein